MVKNFTAASGEIRGSCPELRLFEKGENRMKHDTGAEAT
jgi:hypothetical protein